MDGLKGGANAAWIGARLCSSARARKSGPEARDAASGAPEGAFATRAFRRALPLLREEGNEGGAPRQTFSGADESRLEKALMILRKTQPGIAGILPGEGRCMFQFSDYP